MSTTRSRGAWTPTAPDGSNRGPNGRRYCKSCAAYSGEYVEIPADRQVFCSTACWHHYAERNDPRYIREKVWRRDKGVCAICGLDTAGFAAAIEAGRIAHLRIQQDDIARGYVYYPHLPASQNTWLKWLGVKALGGQYTNVWIPPPFGVNLLALPREEALPRRYEQGAYCLVGDLAASDAWRAFQGTTRQTPRGPRTVLECLGFPRSSRDAPWWDADHIVPVVEGGGECGLENYRTLCKPCHKRETAALARRRAAARRQAHLQELAVKYPHLRLLQQAQLPLEQQQQQQQQAAAG